MNSEQFNILMQGINDINYNLINKNSQKEIPDNADIISLLREKFFEKLELRTGWGRNQIKDAFNEVINEVTK